MESNKNKNKNKNKNNNNDDGIIITKENYKNFIPEGRLQFVENLIEAAERDKVSSIQLNINGKNETIALKYNENGELQFYRATQILELLDKNELTRILAELEKNNNYKLQNNTRIRDRFALPKDDPISRKLNVFGKVYFYLGSKDGKLKAFIDDPQKKIGSGVYGNVVMLEKVKYGRKNNNKEDNKTDSIVKKAEEDRDAALLNENSILEEIELHNAKHKDNPKEQIPYAKYKGAIRGPKKENQKDNFLGYVAEKGGQNLEQIVNNKQITITDDMWLALGHGISNLHKVGIVHSDIKPANIILNKEGTSLLMCDFGLSKKQKDIIKGRFAGTAYFMPEGILHIDFENWVKYPDLNIHNEMDPCEIKKKQDWYGLLASMITHYGVNVSEEPHRRVIREKLNPQGAMSSDLWKEMYQSLSGVQNQDYKTKEAQYIQILKKEGIDNKSIIESFAAGNLRDAAMMKIAKNHEMQEQKANLNKMQKSPPIHDKQEEKKI